MKKHWLILPYYLWLAVFTVVPLALIVFYAVTKQYSFELTLANLERSMAPVYLEVLFWSVLLAAVSTFICFLLGYPLAYILSQINAKYRSMLVMLVIVPMWMNFLLRTYAWLTLLEKNGFINVILSTLHLPAQHLLYTDAAVVLGMVYNFLPFMVLPIYSVLIKMDKSLLEASADLGATRIQTFRKVVFPLSLPGVYAGILMVFMPAVTTFVISRLLGGGQYMLIGNVIEEQFLVVGNWNFGSAVSIVMLIIIMLSLGFIMKNKKEGGMFL